MNKGQACDGWLDMAPRGVCIIPRVNTVTYEKHSLRYLGPFLWLKLDKKVRNSESLNTFKSKIRKLDLVGLTEDNCKTELYTMQ